MRDFIAELRGHLFRINEDDNCGIISSLEGVEAAFKKWRHLHSQCSLDPTHLQETIENLQRGEFLPLYISNQNAGLIIEYLATSQTDGCENTDSGSENSISISTFPAALPSKTVLTSMNGCLLEYPEFSVLVERSDLLLSKEFSKQISNLSEYTCPIAMQTSCKRNIEFVEIRDVANPLLISKLMAVSLTNSKSECNSNMKRIIKKVRDEVVCKRAGVPFRRSGLYMTMKIALQLWLVNKLGDSIGKIIYKLFLQNFQASFLDTCMAKDVELDVALEMIAKIARRLYKLKQGIASNQVAQFLNNFISANFEAISNKIGKVRANLNQAWENIITTEA